METLQEPANGVARAPLFTPLYPSIPTVKIRILPVIQLDKKEKSPAATGEEENALKYHSVLPHNKSASPHSRPPQLHLLIGMLRRARAEQQGVGIIEMVQAGIVHFGWRIFELRKRGFGIANEVHRTPDGRIFSTYWLIFDPELDER
jgi:hypothetical protein